KGKIIATARNDSSNTIDFFDPIGRYSLQELFELRWPWIGSTYIKETRAISVVAFSIRKLAGLKYPLPRCNVGRRDAVILLTAFTTEHKRQQNAIAIVGHKLLSMYRQVSLVFRFERCIDSVTATNKLMQPKSEDGETG